MRTLLIMRGVPGSGKSTWIEENGLKPYALCPDEIRLLCCSPLLQADGTECIGGNSENTVWKVFLQMLKERMRHGAFTVIDSTNIRTEELGGVETGGFLRCVQMDGDGIHPVEIKNPVWLTPELREKQAVEDAVIQLRADSAVVEKRFGNISSFNFTREAFRERDWNERTIQARGLYLDTVQNRVVARAYNKFFNIGERPETRWSALQQNLRFPVSCYVKENGFLGLVSWDTEKESLFITTKTDPEGIAALWFRELLRKKAGTDGIRRMEDYLEAHPVTLVFECVDMEHDPHVIEYPESRVILLDIVCNCMEYEKYSYEQMRETAERLGLEHKELACVLPDWKAFADWYGQVNGKDYTYRGQQIEGFVIEDAAGRMVKLKGAYYRFWKQMRGLAKEIAGKGGIDRRHVWLDAEGEAFCSWLTALYQGSGEKTEPRDICELRRRFLEERR